MDADHFSLRELIPRNSDVGFAFPDELRNSMMHRMASNLFPSVGQSWTLTTFRRAN